MVVVWTIRGKIIRTVLCCIVYDSCTVYTMICAHTCEQFISMSVGLGLVFVHLFRFSILCVFLVYLGGLFCSLLCAFVVRLAGKNV